MARLHEYQGKALLKDHGIAVPEGTVARSIESVREIAEKLGRDVVLKAQTWTTGRAAAGGIKFASTPDRAASIAKEMFRMQFGNFRVEEVLVEERLEIQREFFASIIIDDQEKRPLMLFSAVGGSGIEEVAREHPDSVGRTYFDLVEGLHDFQARNLIRSTGIRGKLQLKLGDILVRLAKTALKAEARTVEINPIVLTGGGNLYAADCRVTVDDYAVFRHPNFEIEVARELNHPPTPLELIAYNVEKGDYRGTFYFIQMENSPQPDRKYIGFHGAGGGGSMMSMDAISRRGYTPANFCDTSGNPPASKVYRAAKIILSQPDIDGYFGSGSGVASQEQFHSARGLVKAFREDQIELPVVIRLGGNSEDKAVKILETYTADLPASVRGYKKDDSVDFCADRFDELMQNNKRNGKRPGNFKPPLARKPYLFETLTGTVRFDHAICVECTNQICIEECASQILELKDGVPVLNISKGEARKGKCSECLACEVDCAVLGAGGGYVHLPIDGLEEYREGAV